MGLVDFRVLPIDARIAACREAGDACADNHDLFPMSVVFVLWRFNANH